MSRNAWKEAYKRLVAMSDEDLERAIRFYQRSPDGQWNNVAADAIRCYQRQRELDRKYKVR